MRNFHSQVAHKHPECSVFKQQQAQRLPPRTRPPLVPCVSLKESPEAGLYSWSISASSKSPFSSWPEFLNASQTCAFSRPLLPQASPALFPSWPAAASGSGTPQDAAGARPLTRWFPSNFSSRGLTVWSLSPPSPQLDLTPCFHAPTKTQTRVPLTLCPPTVRTEPMGNARCSDHSD